MHSNRSRSLTPSFSKNRHSSYRPQESTMTERKLFSMGTPTLQVIKATMFTRGVEAERARVLAIIDAAWQSQKLKPGTRLAMAVIARRVRDPGSEFEPTPR